MLLTSPLVGRAAELGALRQAVERLDAGGGGVVVLEGEAGIGKSRLVGEALSEAAARHLGTLVGASSELEAESPFAPVIDALDLDAREAGAERAALRNLVTAERVPAVTDGEHRVKLLHAFAEFVAQCCDRRGTLLVLEDVHWADPATLLLLERLSRRCAHLPLVLLLTMRPQPRSPPLHSLLASLNAVGSEHLVVSRLADAEVRALVEASLQARAGDGLLSAVRGAAGNPFFVGEVLATLEQEKGLDVEDGVADVARGDAVPSLRLASVRRLSLLPQRCVDLLRTASMLGSSFEVGELSVVAESSTADLAPILGDAVAANVLNEAGTRLAFRHDLVREAIYNDRPAAICEALHHEIARKLREAGYPPLKVAAHLLRGPRRLGEQGIALLRPVARDCTYADPAVSVELLERVSASLSDTDPAVADVKAELAQALVWAGRWSDGERMARELALTERHPGRSVEVLVALVQASAVTGALPESLVRELDAAAHAPDLEPHQLSRLLTIAAQAAFLAGDLRRTRILAGEALDAARHAGDTVRRIEALMALSSVGWHTGRPTDGLAAAAEAVALSGRLPPELAGVAQAPYLLLGMNLALLGRYEEAVPALLSGMERAERANNVWVLGHLHQAQGVGQFYAGLLDAAEGEFEAALTIWQEIGAVDWASIQEAWLGRIAVHRGDVPAARRRLAAADVVLPPGSDWKPSRNVPVVALTRALIGEAQVDRAAAYAALEDARRAILKSSAAYFNLRIGPEFVRLAVDRGDQVAATEMTVATEAVASSVGTPTARAQALRCRGLLTGDAATLVEAAEAHRQGPSRVELAGAAEEAAAALAAGGDSEEAAALLREALEIWESAGAAYDASRVLARLRAGGARPGKRGPRRRAETGWDSLTDSELRVLELVREGLTYREVAERLFVSRRTVETHVARVFRKLGVASRAELSALLIERGAGAARNP